MIGLRGRRRVRTPDVKLPRVDLSDVHLPELKVPRVDVSDVRVPDVKLPDIRLPDVRLPDVHLPSVRLPEVRPPERLRDLELVGQYPFIRKRRRHPLVTALLFALGAGIGLLIGVIAAALLAPAAGEDTRRRLKAMLPGGGASSDPEATSVLPASASGAVSSVRSNAQGGLQALKERFRLATEEARRARERRDRELRDALHEAQRTGHVPESIG